VDTLDAKEAQTIGLDMAAWQASTGRIVRERSVGWSRNGGVGLTARIWIDLPVLVEWPASREDGDHGDEKGSDDKNEPNIDGIAIPLAKAVLSSA
jgi:hypothetical protein